MSSLSTTRLWKSESGSFSIESTLVFPIILTVMLLVVVFAAWTADRAIVYFRASAAAERIAFNWSNSSKAFATGAYPDGRYDGLYRRLFEDAALARLFGIAAGNDGETTVAFPANVPSDDEDLSRRKLREGSRDLGIGMRGELRYRNDLLWGLIVAEAGGLSLYAPIAKFRGKDADASSAARAVSVEPAESVRSFDLIRYYAAKIRSSKEGEPAYRGKAAAIVGRLGVVQ
ncbi:hypothetical protein ACFPVX_11450 [Cohnella faecalis]|uniref:Pilus assembly protein n=1 Tax=Cohnella faecalis TaxID=2315694 RepID=A0A398CE43_9BACL|nr:hypothetical protein [Cohnella faecalis]RIE00900.1 hypothetical protein D3H35_25335 [Cohnella faecalis]